MKTYKVTEECISCHACVEIAEKNFKMGEKIAYVYKQPENEAEEIQSRDALEVCPVGAIVSEEQNIVYENKQPILAKDKVKETLA